MRPVIKPSLRRLRRDRSTVQIGLNPARAILLSGTAAATVLDSMDGTRNRAEVLARARSAGVTEETASRVLDTLAGRGVLDDAATDCAALRGMSLTERDRIRPDLAALSILSGAPDAGLSELGLRRRSTVHVRGAGRVGSTIASLLASAGIGHVHPIDPAPARAEDAAPAGLAASEAGTPREDASAAALDRVAPGVRTDERGRPDLVVLAPVDGVDPDLELCDALARDAVPHLLVSVREGTGAVGPLVLPGRSSCIRCQHLYRFERDPDWPRLAAQLAAPRVDVEACDVTLATAVGALATGQVLAWLDQAAAPTATVGGSLELSLPDLCWRRRSWPVHPRCGCHWDSSNA